MTIKSNTSISSEKAQKTGKSVPNGDKTPRITADPRIFQIFTLITLLTVGLATHRIDTTATNVAIALSACFLTQWLIIARGQIDRSTLSAVITGLSLAILLRASPEIITLSGIIAIASKRFIRINSAHIFNPANGAIALITLLSDNAWISPGQWGHSLWIGALIMFLALLVLGRAQRYSTAIAFIGFYGTLLLARALYLGDPLTIPLHQLQSGALLIFTFFMITDPKTTPQHLHARILFAAAVATITAILQWVWFVPVAIIYALAITSPFVPYLNRKFPAPRYQWSS